MLFAGFAVRVTIALATVLLYALIAVVVVGALALVLRYIRRKTP